jgi:hypothetical protein
MMAENDVPIEIRLIDGKTKEMRKMPRIIHAGNCAAICIYFFLTVKTTFSEVADTCLPIFPCIKRIQTLWELMVEL